MLMDAGTVVTVITFLVGNKVLERAWGAWTGRRRAKAEEGMAIAQAGAHEASAVAEATASPRSINAKVLSEELNNAERTAKMAFEYAERVDADAEAARVEADRQTEIARSATARAAHLEIKAGALEVEARDARAATARQLAENRACEALVGVLRAQLSAVVRAINAGKQLPAKLADLDIDTADIIPSPVLSPVPRSK